MPDWLPDSPAAALIFRLLLILLVTLLAMTGVRLAARQVQRRLERLIAVGERRARLNTLLQAGVSVSLIVIGTISLMMVLNQFEIDIAPILASAGVAGLALSLGSQTFIKDFFGGVVILVENQFTIGDIIKVGEVTGTVERITLRATYLRDQEGRRVSIPNGDIRTISNLSTEWARAIVTLTLPRDSNMEDALTRLQSAAAQVQNDPLVKPLLLEEPRVEGWVDLTETGIQMRLTAKTLPGRQWEVAQALRKQAMQHLNRPV